MKVISNRRGAGLSGWGLMLSLLLLLLLTTGWFVARTEWARGQFEQRLSVWLGMPVSLENCRIGWPYTLILEDLRSLPEQDYLDVEIRIDQIRLGRRLRYWTLALKRPHVRMQVDDEGHWHPALSGRLAARQIDSPDWYQNVFSALEGRWRVDVKQGNLVWLDALGHEQSWVRQVDFLLQPVRLPEGRRMNYFRITFASAEGVGVGNYQDVSRAWLSSQVLPYVELLHTPGTVEAEPEGIDTKRLGGQDVD